MSGNGLRDVVEGALEGSGLLHEGGRERRARPPGSPIPASSRSWTHGGSNYRITFDQPPEPLDALPRHLTIEDFVEPTS
ncbi:hypothetical protein ACFQ7F_32960 [Streptomyces sp. NPDC056486]|uniref:hypothetical protein n=1 Tax=Streptomyces sp. NPDC056486 TaxID=3345835 RepID=UPI003695637E